MNIHTWINPKSLDRAKGRVQKLSAVLADRIHLEGTQSVQAVRVDMYKAFDSGAFSSKEKTLQFMHNLASNIQKKPKWKCYDEHTRAFYEVLKIWGGWRIANFVSKALDGPGEASIKRYLRQSKVLFQFGVHEDTFKEAAEMYKKMNELKGIQGPILVEQAEDETVIIKMLQYLQ